MLVVVPYWKDSGNPYNSRVIGLVGLTPKEQHLYAMFAQAFWFAIEQGILPSPWAGPDLQSAMIKWTGQEFFE